MTNVLSLKQRSVEVKNEISSKLKAVDSGDITPAEFTQYMEKAGKEFTDIGESIKAYDAGRGFVGAEGSGEGEGGAPQIPVDPALRSKQAQQNWATYKQLAKIAKDNMLARDAQGVSSQHACSFNIALKGYGEPIRIPSDEQLGMKAQGVAGLQGTQTSGTTTPPTGMHAPGVYFPGGTAGPVIEPYFEPGIAEMRFYPNVIEMLFPSLPTSSPTVSYVKQSGFTNNAAATAEGATKPTSSIAVARYQDTVGKITNLERVTDETIEDAPQFWALVQQDGVLGVTRQFEVELLAGVGLPGINGILNRNAPAGGLSYPSGFLRPATVTAVTNVVIGGGTGSGATSATVASITPGRKFTLAGDATDGTAMAEALLTAITDIRVNTFFEPDAMVLNPVDWQKIRLAKDANGQYLGGSFFGTNYGVAQNAGNTGIEENLTLWSKRAISTPVQPLGLPMVGDFRDAGKVLRLGGMRVDVTNTNGFDFEQNLWTLRCEIRAGLQMKRPELIEIIQFA